MAIRRFPMGHIHERSFHETARRLEAERMSAPALVDDALRQTPRDRWSTLAERSDLITIGAIEHLETALNAEITRDPKRAYALARLALSLAEALPPHSYPTITLAQTRARAWKDVGKLLSYLSRHAEADQAFAEAERCIEPSIALDHDLAILRLNRAINYLESDRPREAVALLTWCRTVFQDHRDTGRVVLTNFYEGRVQQSLHQYREARETYLLLIASHSEIPKQTLAALHQSIGLCSIDLKDYRAAEDNLQKAITLHNELGQTLDALKGEHGRGRLLIRQGYPRRGLAVLRPVRHQYLKHSLAEEAGLCGFEMVGALLMLDEFEKAERLARTIMNEFLAAAMNARALTALGYLTEAIVSRKASPTLVDEVYDYVLSLRTKPEREFTQLPSTAAD